MFTFNSFCLCCLNTLTEDVLQGFCFYFLVFFLCDAKTNTTWYCNIENLKEKKRKKRGIEFSWYEKQIFPLTTSNNWKRWEKKIMMQRQTRADIFWGVVFHRFFFFLLYVSWLFAFLSFHKFFWFLTFFYCQEIEFSSFFLLSFLVAVVACMTLLNKFIVILLFWWPI